MPPPSERTSGEPEVPPDVPAEYADAYLAGFRRGLDGLPSDLATEQVAAPPQPEPPTTAEPVDQPDPADGFEPREQWAGEQQDGNQQDGEQWAEEQEPAEELPGDHTSAHTGATSTAGSTEGPAGRSLWPLVGLFVVALLLLMVLAYAAGMAVSGFVNG